MADEKHPEEKQAEHREVTQGGAKILLAACPHCGQQTAHSAPGLTLCNCCRRPVRF